MRDAGKNLSGWPEKPGAGVCLHLTSLPGAFGIGEIGATAFAFIDKLKKMNLGVWQFLPIGPTGFGDSPYQSLSSFAGNEMLIDMHDLVEHGFLAHREIDTLRELPDDAVDYARLIPRKNAILELAAGRFTNRASPDVKTAYAEFLHVNDARWLHDYAIFRALKNDNQQRSWTEWPASLRSRDRKALSSFASKFRQAIENVKVQQFLFHRQWRKLTDYAREQGIRLFGDLPIYVALDSVDAWTNRDLLCMGDAGIPRLVAGVPPDYFNKNGQLWGNPVYDWPAHAKSHYRWWIDRLQHAATLADLVRIDHFRGFDSYWTVPQSATSAREGAWLSGPQDALLDALRAEAGLEQVVAEDLGIITPEVTALRKRYGIPGMKVLQFEVPREDFALADIESDCVCYTATHDSDTTLGWFHGSPGDTRSRAEIRKTRKRALAACHGKSETIHHDMLRLALASAAQLAIAPMQDFLGLGSDARLNTPGSASDNWRWRLPATQPDEALLARIGAFVAVAGRDA